MVHGAGAAAAKEEEDGVKVECKGNGKEANADKKGKGKGAGTVDPIVPMRNVEVLDSIERFYGLDPGAAFKFRTQLTARSVDAHPKRLSYLSSGARELPPTPSRELLPVRCIPWRVSDE